MKYEHGAYLRLSDPLSSNRGLRPGGRERGYGDFCCLFSKYTHCGPVFFFFKEKMYSEYNFLLFLFSVRDLIFYLLLKNSS